MRTVLPWIGKPAQQYPFVLGALQQRRPRNQDCNISEKLCSCLVASGVQVDATLSLNSSSASSSPPAAESGSFHMTGATFITFLAAVDARKQRREAEAERLERQRREQLQRRELTRRSMEGPRKSSPLSSHTHYTLNHNSSSYNTQSAAGKHTLHSADRVLRPLNRHSCPSTRHSINSSRHAHSGCHFHSSGVDADVASTGPGQIQQSRSNSRAGCRHHQMHGEAQQQVLCADAEQGVQGASAALPAVTGVLAQPMATAVA